ncbi:hypothetical protein PQX77_008346 [Marasmius sp. AFHP31]|nr:hypothetical protein PQX77_008346 [Marasmius sp. AFHP31]
MTSGLRSLPNEILREIASLTGNDIKTLCLVDKHTNQVVNPVIWDTFPIILNFNRENLGSNMSILEDLDRTPVDKFRKLEIKSLDPSKELIDPDCRTWSTMPDGTCYPPMPEDTEELMEVIEGLPKILPGALYSLKGLRSVDWTITKKSPDWIQSTVLQFLRTLLPLTVDPPKSDASQGIGSLQTLIIRSKNSLNPPEFVSSLAAVLTHNPHLTHLELDMEEQRHGEQLSFRDLFQNVPPETIHLHSLLLRGWSIEVTAQMRPHLNSLRSIQLPQSWPHVHPGHEGLWKSLTTSPPSSLRHVSSGWVSDGLLDFLQSISGLDDLELGYAGGYTDQESDRLARRFYDDVLPQQRKSLKRLHVYPAFTGSWTVGLRDVNRFDGCVELMRLCVGLDPDEIRPDEGEEGDVVTSFLSQITRLPRLSVLILPSVRHKKYRNKDRKSGTYIYIDRRRNEKQIREALDRAVISDADSQWAERSLRVYSRRIPRDDTWLNVNKGDHVSVYDCESGSLGFA